MAAMTAMIATIFIPVFAVNLPMLLAGNFINGIPWGGKPVHQPYADCSLPDSDYRLCCRDLPYGVASQFDQLGQYLLGFRYVLPCAHMNQADHQACLSLLPLSAGPSLSPESGDTACATSCNG